MSKFLIMIVLVAAASSEMLAQQSYRAIIVHGRPYLATPKGFFQVSPGDIVADSSRLTLLDNCQLTLMDEKGRLVDLNQEGSFDLSNVDLSLGQDSSEYIYNLWTQFYEDVVNLSSSASSEDKTKESFSLFLPSSSEIFGFKALLRWTDQASDKYEVEFLDEFEQIFHQVTTRETKLELDLLSKAFAWRRYFLLRVRNAKTGLQTGMYGIKKSSPEDFEEGNTLLEELPDDEDVFSILSRAVFFEQRGWIADVHMLLFPRAEGNETIKSFYASFLKRNGFVDSRD